MLSGESQLFCILHGVPRATFDLDILIEATEDNSQRLLDALEEAQFGIATMINAKELMSHEITIFQDRVRIDAQTFTPGIDFFSAWENKETMNYQGQEFYVLSKADLISSKKAAGRERDLEDVRLLTLDD
ncbi:MAG: hypothetical protein ACXW4Q_01025 [Anaerolineales bacterium]